MGWCSGTQIFDSVLDVYSQYTPYSIWDEYCDFKNTQTSYYNTDWTEEDFDINGYDLAVDWHK